MKSTEANFAEWGGTGVQEGGLGDGGTDGLLMKVTDLRDPPELADLIARAIKLHRDMSEEERDHMREMQRRSLAKSVRREIAEGGTV